MTDGARVVMDGRYLWPDMGARLAKIRETAGFTEQRAFALHFDFSPGSWNHWERGMSIPWGQALRLIDSLRDIVPGLTLDWIYRGDPRGLPVETLRQLRRTEDLSPHK